MMHLNVMQGGVNEVVPRVGIDHLSPRVSAVSSSVLSWTTRLFEFCGPQQGLRGVYFTCSTLNRTTLVQNEAC